MALYCCCWFTVIVIISITIVIVIVIIVIIVTIVIICSYCKLFGFFFVLSILLWEWAMRVRMTGDVWTSFCKRAYVVWRRLCATRTLHKRLVAFFGTNGRLGRNVIVPHGKQVPLLPRSLALSHPPSLPPSLLTPSSLFLPRFLSLFLCRSLLSHHKRQFRSLRRHIFHANWRIALQCFTILKLFAVFLSNGSIRSTSGGVQSESHGRVQTSSGAMVGPCGTPVASASKSAPNENVDLNLTRELTMQLVVYDL